MMILAIDTAANMCAACLLDQKTGTVRGVISEDIGNGHAEQLMPIIERVFSQANAVPSDVGKIAVSVGPGSFTGVRVGVATARGLALALGIPVVGVSTFQTIARDFMNSRQTTVDFTVALNGGRGDIFCQRFNASGAAVGSAFAMGPESPRNPITVIGNAARKVNADGVYPDFEIATGSINAYAEVGMISDSPAYPIYLRAADAKVQKGFALPLAQYEVP